MKVAVEGCAHGDLDAIYGTIQHIERTENVKIDLLLCCGDFQAVRNKDDLDAVAVPRKYREMKDFYKYYSGEKVAPVLTIFIGGNHEASNHLQDLTQGGWVAPNIYYMGLSSMVRFGGLRIAGLSGIYKNFDYRTGYHEKQPYNESTMRSIYHVREYDVFKMLQIDRPIDVFLSHDWPQGIMQYGDKEKLLNVKKFLRDEEHTLGSPPAMKLMKVLEPSYWFSAHMHAKFPALVKHESGKQTKFLALSKVLPGQDFLQVLDIESPADAPLRLEYDAEWLLIVLSTLPLRSEAPRNVSMPSINDAGRRRYDYRPTDEQIQMVHDIAGGPDGLVIPTDAFVRNVIPFGSRPGSADIPSTPFANPQHERFMQFLRRFQPAADLPPSEEPEDQSEPPVAEDVADVEVADGPDSADAVPVDAVPVASAAAADPVSLADIMADAMSAAVATEPVASAETASEPNYGALSAKELKQILQDRGVDFSDCVEKSDLVRKVQENPKGHR
eukprot:TRINITY_DN6379_c0_g1_i2.p1 TRINITY_DN6379_c0_g1~~TRINITY_DN6379_c0_g1_i2.p1  ORF type:complete len:499 (+),score=143.14 TRINITY_DN6379_c0_g1_i2:143-1639(+)